MTQEKYVFVIPQFNDWEALNLLIDTINRDVEEAILLNTSLLIVDDCSSIEPIQPYPNFKGKEIRQITLARNLGHQRAIAIGLSYVADQMECDKVVVLDADGEDAPSDINKLVKRSKEVPGKVVFARRTKRQESFLFQKLYIVYKLLFKLLTGKIITFGNFSIVPYQRLITLVKVSEIWNNYPVGIIRSRIPYDDIPTERAKRLAGTSKMNLVSLVLHGFSAISVMIDMTAVRILIFSIFLSVVAGIFICSILFLKLIGNATPGWASTLGVTLLMLIFQAFTISLFLVFMVLHSRTQQSFIPALQYKDFIAKVETL
jgi:hypothetical protein